MSSSPTQVAGSSAPRVTNDEVRAVLHSHIRKTARFIKFLDLSVHLFAWVAAMFALWLLACVVDHWLAPLSSIGRWLFWTSAVVGTTWWLLTQLVPLLFQRINPAYAAKRIEHLLPEFKNGLISWLELDQMPDSGVPRGIMSALTYRAARFIGGQDPSTIVDTSRLIKLVGVVLLLFTSLVVYTMVSPKSVLDTGKRIAMPWRSIAAPSRVQILSVTPGAVELTQGKPMDVEVEVRGIRTKEAVRVRFTTTDGQLRDQRIDLAAVSEGYRYSGKVRTETSGVEHELDYWVEAGDAISGPYRVTLSPLPSVVLDQVELKFPAYTKIPDRKVTGGDFEAIEGTRATIHALANQTMSRGRWEINPEIDAAGELSRADSVYELGVDDRKLTGTVLLQLNSEKENPTKLTYRLRGFNQRGDGNREPILHSVKVIADVAPEIKLVGPENRRVKVRPTSRLNLEVQANDPDFGLSEIDIEIRRGGIVLLNETVLKSEGAIGQQIKRLPINMADFRISEGSTLEVRAIAHDNRHDPVSERPAPNSKESEPLTLEVVGADQEAVPDQEPMPASDSTEGDAQAEKNQNAGNEGSRSGSNSGNRNDRGPDNNASKQNDPNGAEPPKNSPNENGESQDPSQKNQNPNSPDSNANQSQGDKSGDKQGSKQGDQGKQEGNQQGKQQGQQGQQGQQQDGQQQDGQQQGSQTQSKSDEGKQKPGSTGQQAGGQQGGGQSGQAGKQQSKDQGSQTGSQSGGSESKDGNSQSNSSSGNSSDSGKSPSASGQSGKQPSNSIGQQSNSPNSDSSNEATGNPSNSEGGASKDAANAGRSDGGSKPSDGEVVKRVQEYMEDKNSQSNSQGNAPQKTDNSNASSKDSSTSQEGTAGPKPQGKGEDAKGSDAKGAQSEGTQSPDGAQSEGANSDPKGAENDRTGSKEDKSNSTNVLGQRNPQANQPSQAEAKSNSNDSTGKQNTSENNASKGNESTEKNSNQQPPDRKGNSESKDDKSSSGKSSEGKGSEGKSSEGKSSEGKGSEGKGSEGKGSEGKGSDGKGSDGKGSDGKGSEGKGSDGKGSEGKGSEDKGSEGKGSEGKGSEGKGSEGKGASSDANGSDAKGADGKSSESKGADGKSADGKSADGKSADGKNSESKSAEAGSQGESASKGDSGSGSEAGKPGGSSEGGGKANGSKAGKSGSSGSGVGNGEGGGDGKADDANEDYANRTTQMVLDYLNRQKDQPDPELLRELKWSKEDLRNFTDRWNKARDLAASPNPEDQKKWKEMLEDLGLNRQSIKPSAAGSVDDNFQQMRDSGSRTRPPENLRKQYEAFRRAFEKSSK